MGSLVSLSKCLAEAAMTTTTTTITTTNVRIILATRLGTVAILTSVRHRPVPPSSSYLLLFPHLRSCFGINFWETEICDLYRELVLTTWEAVCDKYLCPDTLACVHFPHHCPCAWADNEDKFELGEGARICLSKGGFKEGEAARKVELARKGLL